MFGSKRHPALLRQVMAVQSDRAWRGVLYDVRGRYLVLRDAYLIERGAEPAKADGEVILEESKVEYLQAIGG